MEIKQYELSNHLNTVYNIKVLMIDDDITNKRRIYAYVLSEAERYLNIRAYTESQKRTACELQSGACPVCNRKISPSRLQKRDGDVFSFGVFEFKRMTLGHAPLSFLRYVCANNVSSIILAALATSLLQGLEA